MMARAAVRDVGRALGVAYSKCDQIAKMIPMGKQGFHMTLDKALERARNLRKFMSATRRPANFGHCQKAGRLRPPRHASTPPA